jgi:AhpD family alkylhydroperoxidase
LNFNGGIDMLANWKELLQQNLEAFGELGKGNPELVNSVANLGANGTKGVLDAKTRELIALAVAATTRCDGCIAIHVPEAIKAGATRDEILDTLAVAVAMNAGPAAIYSSRILEAFDQHKA